MPSARPSWSKRVRVRVPATTSNLGPGFDVLGMALKLYCELEVRAAWPDLRRKAWHVEGSATPREGVRVLVEGEGAGELPEDATNLIVRSFRKVVPAWDAFPPLEFRIRNEIPLARGLGSSAAARLCGLLAAEALLDSKAGRSEALVDQACRLEGHPDNVVAAYHGGLRACLRDGDRLLQFGLRLPKDLGVVVCIPDFKVETALARRALPAQIAHADAVATSSRLAFLIGALERGEYGWLKTAMKDVLHQPYRKKLVPGMEEVIRAAEQAGAFGAALSGSGPAILALALRGNKQPLIGRAMQKAFLRAGAESRYLVLDPEPKGARVEAR